jgi:hypothetical protein
MVEELKSCFEKCRSTFDKLYEELNDIQKTDFIRRKNFVYAEKSRYQTFEADFERNKRQHNKKRIEHFFIIGVVFILLNLFGFQINYDLLFYFVIAVYIFDSYKLQQLNREHKFYEAEIISNFESTNIHLKLIKKYIQHEKNGHRDFDMKTDDVDKQTYSYTAWLYKMRIDFAILGVVTNGWSDTDVPLCLYEHIEVY